MSWLVIRLGEPHAAQAAPGVHAAVHHPGVPHVRNAGCVAHLADQAVNLTGADRLITISKVSIIDSFPVSHYEKVQAVQGVNSVVHLNWFGGVYKDGKAQIPVFPMNVEEFFKVYPEVKITPEEFAAWKADRQGMVIGQVLADTYGWKKGDRVPIKSSIFRKANNSDTWEFNIVAIYKVENSAGWDNQSAMFHYDYYNESLMFGKDQIGWMTVKVADPDQSEAVAKRIDDAVRQFIGRDQDGHGKGVHQAVHGADRQHRQDPGLGGVRRVLHHAAGDGQHDGAVGARTHQRDRRAEDAGIQRGFGAAAGHRRGRVPHRARRTHRLRTRLSRGGWHGDAS